MACDNEQVCGGSCGGFFGVPVRSRNHGPHAGGPGWLSRGRGCPWSCTPGSLRCGAAVPRRDETRAPAPPQRWF